MSIELNLKKMVESLTDEYNVVEDISQKKEITKTIIELDKKLIKELLKDPIKNSLELNNYWHVYKR
jgi:hypothetical protein